MTDHQPDSNKDAEQPSSNSDPLVSLQNHLKQAFQDIVTFYNQTMSKDIEEKIQTADKAVTKGLVEACDSMIDLAADIKRKLKERERGE